MAESAAVDTRWFAADRAAFIVRCPSEDVRDAVEWMLRDLPSADPAGQPALIELVEDAAGYIVVRGPDRVEEPQVAGGALASVVTIATKLSLDHDPSRLHLHAAALSWQGRGVVISARSGTGKTTLAAALALDGWTYTSDEAIALDGRSTTASGHAKPLIIKPGGTHLFPSFDEIRARVAGDVSDWWLVPLSAAGVELADTAEPRAVVLLSRAADDEVDRPPTVSLIHPADAVVALMEQTMDAERFGPRAVEVLASLCAACHCIALTVGHLAPSVEVLAELVVRPVAPTTVECLPTQHTPGAGWVVPHHVVSVILGDRVVIHDTRGGAIVALDEAGTAAWSAVYGRPPSWWDPASLVESSVVGFLEELGRHGLVERAGVGRP